MSESARFILAKNYQNYYYNFTYNNYTSCQSYCSNSDCLNLMLYECLINKKFTTYRYCGKLHNPHKLLIWYDDICSIFGRNSLESSIGYHFTLWNLYLNKWCKSKDSCKSKNENRQYICKNIHKQIFESELFLKHNFPKNVCNSDFTFPFNLFFTWKLKTMLAINNRPNLSRTYIVPEQIVSIQAKYAASRKVNFNDIHATLFNTVVDGREFNPHYYFNNVENIITIQNDFHFDELDRQQIIQILRQNPAKYAIILRREADAVAAQPELPPPFGDARRNIEDEPDFARAAPAAAADSLSRGRNGRGYVALYEHINPSEVLKQNDSVSLSFTSKEQQKQYEEFRYSIEEYINNSMTETVERLIDRAIPEEQKYIDILLHEKDGVMRLLNQHICRARLISDKINQILDKVDKCKELEENFDSYLDERKNKYINMIENEIIIPHHDILNNYFIMHKKEIELAVPHEFVKHSQSASCSICVEDDCILFGVEMACEGCFLNWIEKEQSKSIVSMLNPDIIGVVSMDSGARRYNLMDVVCKLLSFSENPAKIATINGQIMTNFHVRKHQIELQVQEEKIKRDLSTKSRLDIIALNSTDLITKKCPKCKIPIERISGCACVKCQCGVEVCVKCYQCFPDGGGHAHVATCLAKDKLSIGNTGTDVYYTNKDSFKRFINTEDVDKIRDYLLRDVKLCGDDLTLVLRKISKIRGDLKSEIERQFKISL